MLFKTMKTLQLSQRIRNSGAQVRLLVVVSVSERFLYDMARRLQHVYVSLVCGAAFLIKVC